MIVYFFDEDSVNVTYCCDEMGILCANLNNTNLDDTSYDKYDPDTIISCQTFRLAW